MKKQEKYCGHITIIGNTNVGKSTLINQIIGKKISIVSRKKNTTQDNIIGIKTEENYQSIYTDTPGFIFSKKKIQIKFQNDSNKIIKNSNLIMLVTDRIFWTKNDDIILNKIKKTMIPIFMIINKIDKLTDKKDLLPFIQFLKKKNNFKEIIPISAKKQKDIFFLNNIIKLYLPKNPHIYAKNYITKNSIFFTISEIIRKQLILFSGDELPTIIRVEIESFQETKQKEIFIKAIVWVNNERQRRIIIGHNGDKIKKISIISRYKVEKEYNMKTHLTLWVKNKF